MNQKNEQKKSAQEMSSIKKLTLSAMFLALGVILPFFIGQIPQIGSMLLPMHIPVFLCAFVCGWKYGVPVAVILPLLRSVLFGVPVMYPVAISAACEMAAYAFAADYLYCRSPWHCIRTLYRCLVVSMLAGRLVRTAVQLALMGFGGKPIDLGEFFMGTIVTGLPGAALQLVVIPAIMLAFHRTKLVSFRHHHKAHSDLLHNELDN